MVLLVNTNLRAEDIWTRNFSDVADLNKGYWGSNVDMEGVVDWSLDVTNCTLADDSDYVKVVETSGGRLEAVDCDGEAVWMSKAIDISSYTNCTISVLAAETGSSTNSNKYLKCYYKIDGGAEQLFTVNGENVGNWGSANPSASGLEGDELRIIVRMNNPNAGDKVYFDNITVSGDLTVVENDSFTVLKKAENQLGKLTINTDVDTESEALPCFRFIIDETDSASDGVPTKISRMTFYNPNPKNGIDWKSQLGGVRIYSKGNIVNYQAVSISSDSLYFDFLEDHLSIPDGSKREFELRAYLNSAHELVDGSKLQLALGKAAKGFSTFASGSDFTGSNESINSLIHTINVEATQLTLTEIPESVVRNQLFQFSVEAKDQFGNLDTDQDEQISLSLHSGKGELTATNGLINRLDKGKRVFDALKYQIVDTIQLKLMGENLPELISPKIIIKNTYESEALPTSWILVHTLISALNIHKSSAFKLFEFAIKDSGNDGAPTVLKKIPIIAGESNQVDFKKSIAGFYLMRNNREIDVDFEILKDKIDVFFQESEPAAIVDSESEVSYSLFAYFKEGACVDKEIIQLRIEKSSENWEIAEEESGLKLQFDNEVLGPSLECEVKAVQMQFGSIPKTVRPNEVFAVEIEMLDELGNLDTDFDKHVAISLAAGRGELKSVSGLSKTMDNGKMIWTDLKYDKAEHFTIQAEAEGFETILSKDILSVDQNSTLTEGEKIANHLLTSLSVTEERAITALNFTITDLASFDDLPTIINTAIFYKKELPNSFDWEKHIAGAVIKSEGEILSHSNDIDNERIKFSSSKGLFQVSNGVFQKFELAIYFKESSLPDNMEFQVFIPKSGSGWKTGINSSELKTSMLKDINSESFSLNVVADRLSIASSPLFVNDNSEQFNLKVLACDKYQNIDIDNTDKISLELIQGDGELIHDNELGFNKGTLDVNSISYSGKKDFKLRLSSILGSDTCSIAFGKSLLDILYDFDESSLDGFTNSSDWFVSSYQAIQGSKSLKHNLSNQVGNSYISRKLDNWRSENGITRWTFVLRNGDWDPSSGNNFVFHLCMDHENPAKAKVKYSVGVNLKGSSDILSIWKTNRGETPEVLAKTRFDWNANEAIAIKVEYNANGTWNLAYNRMGENNSWYKMEDFSSVITDKSEEFYCGLEFTFESASRAGELWFDDFQVQSVNTAPFIKSYQIIGHDSILIAFSERLNSDQQLTPENFKISCNDEELNDFKPSITNLGNEILIVLHSELKTGNYQVEVLNIIDKDGAKLTSDSIVFEYLAPANEYDVVINEIMADESPSQGLPEYEYIELYNTRAFPISVEGWKLQIGSKELLFSSDTIQANSYLILCSNPAEALFSEYGNAMGLSNFTGLTNAGNSLSLLSANGKTIDEIVYSDTWYQPEEKSNGGWSLERIDPMNFAWQEPNWKASNATDGGTPGKQNSVFAENKDQTLPQIEKVEVVNTNTVRITYSEPMQELEVLQISNYKVAQGKSLILKIHKIEEVKTIIEIVFQENLLENSRFKLEISERVSDLAGNPLKTNLVEFWMPASAHQGDIVINEILFNPLAGGSDYVELFNRTQNVYDLSQMYIGKKDENYLLTDSVKLAKKQILLHPESYCLFTADSLNIAENYYTSNTAVFHQVSLPNYPDKNGRIVLYTKDELIDDLAYKEGMHFELLASKEGVALERVNPDEETNLHSNWQSAAQNIGFGTPGIKNSVYSDAEESVEEVSLSSKIFSPDNDGIDDRLYINFNLKDDGFVANIRIYNALGKEIRKLASNLYLGTDDSVYWDGLNSKRERLPIGIYLVYIEIFNPDSRMKIYKKTCVIGGKLK